MGTHREGIGINYHIGIPCIYSNRVQVGSTYTIGRNIGVTEGVARFPRGEPIVGLWTSGTTQGILELGYPLFPLRSDLGF